MFTPLLHKILGLSVFSSFDLVFCGAPSPVIVIRLRMNMMFRRSEHFVTRAWLLFWFCGFMSGEQADECSFSNFAQSAHYRRSTNRTSVCLRVPYMRCLVRLEGAHLVPIYPWVNVSEMVDERRLALVQLETLLKVAAYFPDKDLFSFEITIASTMAMATISADRASATWDMTTFRKEDENDLKATILEPYVGKENLTAFLQSRNVVLKRWRELCQKSNDMDRRENANVTFVYRADISMFECSVTTLAPLYLAVKLACGGSHSLELPIVSRSDADESATQVMRWNETRCDGSGAKCTVGSTSGWQIMLEPEIVGRVPAVVTRASDIGESVTVSFFITLLILGLLMCGFYWYRSSVRTERGCSFSYLRCKL